MTGSRTATVDYSGPAFAVFERSSCRSQHSAAHRNSFEPSDAGDAVGVEFATRKCLEQRWIPTRKRVRNRRRWWQ